jgi:hypothetical protein
VSLGPTEPAAADPARPWGAGPCPRCGHDTPHTPRGTVRDVYGLDRGAAHECDTFACGCGWVDGERNADLWP